MRRTHACSLGVEVDLAGRQFASRLSVPPVCISTRAHLDRDIVVSEPPHPFMEQWWPAGHVIGWQSAFVHEWRAFLSTIVAGEISDLLQATFYDGLRTNELAQAVLRSAERAGVWGAARSMRRSARELMTGERLAPGLTDDALSLTR